MIIKIGIRDDDGKPVHAELDKVERVTDIALRNRISWRKCYEILHRLDRNPDFELRWFQTDNGYTDAVCINRKR